jgi:hypothetical protein
VQLRTLLRRQRTNAEELGATSKNIDEAVEIKEA